MCVCMYISMCAYVLVGVYVCVCLYVCTYVWVCVDVLMYVCFASICAPCHVIACELCVCVCVSSPLSKYKCAPCFNDFTGG